MHLFDVKLSRKSTVCTKAKRVGINNVLIFFFSKEMLVLFNNSTYILQMETCLYGNTWHNSVQM